MLGWIIIICEEESNTSPHIGEKSYKQRGGKLAAQSAKGVDRKMIEREVESIEGWDGKVRYYIEGYEGLYKTEREAIEAAEEVDK